MQVGGFVAVELPPVHGGTKVVVDLVARDGEQVRIELSGASGKEVVALAEALWKRGRFADPTWIDYNLRQIRKWNLTPEIESKILGGNAARLIP